ncbi:MAG: class I SAM-dependent methyltransferase [bacterium]|nr:class I SAM-dependent methyltransferase [bacterium]
MLYQHLSSHYDIVFPLQEKTLAFLESHLPMGRILDLACGTGTYALALASKGYLMEASDLSEDMIAYAIKKSRQSKHDITFHVQDMRDLDSTSTYDGIYIIGNSLVHVESLSQAKALIKHMYQALLPSGILIIQILNYTKILKELPPTLPGIVVGDLHFSRIYRYIPPYIEFETSLSSPDIQSSERMKLWPITHEQLIHLLTDEHFCDIVCFDGFSKAPFQVEQSFQFVIKAKKG